MSTLTYPRPDNVRGKFGRWVTADMFNISQRIREIEEGQRLYIQALDHPIERGEHVWNFVIVEVDESGTERWVTGVESLDGRVIEHVQMLLRVPFAKRLEEAERLEEKRRQDDIDAQLDNALEDWGWGFRRQLEHDGFIEHRGRSFPKRGVHAVKREPTWRLAH